MSPFNFFFSEMESREDKMKIQLKTHFCRGVKFQKETTQINKWNFQKSNIKVDYIFKWPVETCVCEISCASHHSKCFKMKSEIRTVIIRQ